MAEYYLAEHNVADPLEPLKMTRGAVRRAKEKHLSHIQCTIHVLKQDMAVSECLLIRKRQRLYYFEQDTPMHPDKSRIWLAGIRFFRACIILAKMHSYFDKQLLKCNVTDALAHKKKWRRRQSLDRETWGMEIDLLDDLFNCLKAACPKSCA